MNYVIKMILCLVIFVGMFSMVAAFNVGVALGLLFVGMLAFCCAIPAIYQYHTRGRP